MSSEQHSKDRYFATINPENTLNSSESLPVLLQSEPLEMIIYKKPRLWSKAGLWPWLALKISARRNGAAIANWIKEKCEVPGPEPEPGLGKSVQLQTQGPTGDVRLIH